MIKASKAMLALAALSSALPARAAAPITRTVDPAMHFPIATAVEVPAGYSTVYLSGTGAPIADKASSPTTFAAYGDTETQTRAVFERIQDQLGKLHLAMGDVVAMHVFLVADPKLGHADFAGMMRAYRQFFGTSAQPHLPARAAIPVPALANPGWLVEIEVTAARPPSQ